MKNKRIATSFIVAISIAALSLMWLCAWRDLSIYCEYKRGKLKTVTSECVSVSVAHTDEPRLHSAFTIYSLHLKNGISVAIYKDEQVQIKHVSQQKKVLEQQFVTGRPITVSFVASPSLTNDTYALIYAFDCGEMCLDATPHYCRRFNTMIVMNSTLYGISLLFMVSPMFSRLYKKAKHKKEKRYREKEKQRHEELR